MPVVLALNKIDLVAKPRLLPLIEQVQAVASISPRSCRCRRRRATASSGWNGCCSSRCRKAKPLYPDDYLTDQPERTLVAETVREKVLQHTRAELPFSTAVVVDQFDEPDASAILRLYCTILVETRVAEADRDRPRGRDDQANRHGGAHATSKRSSRRRSSWTCASRSSPTGATTSGS